MEQYEEVPEGTLASVVTSKNRYARRYINMVLGKVMLCDRYEDLKNIRYLSPESVCGTRIVWQVRSNRKFLVFLYWKTGIESTAGTGKEEM